MSPFDPTYSFTTVVDSVMNQQAVLCRMGYLLAAMWSACLLDHCEHLSLHLLTHAHLLRHVSLVSQEAAAAAVTGVIRLHLGW